MTTIALAIIACRVAPAYARVEQHGRTVARSAVADLARYYVYPSRARVAGALVRTKASGGAYDGLQKDRLGDAITSDLASVLHDKHVRVSYTDDVNAPDASSGTGPSPQERAETTAAERYIGYGLGRIAHLPGNVGYVEIRGFVGASPARDVVVDAMVDAVAYSRTVIVDLRRNGGGDPDTVARFLSHFLAPKTHLNDFVGRGDGNSKISQSTFTARVTGPTIRAPLYVLTSSRTFSGGEECAYDIRALKRGTIVGETTGGGANPGITHRIDDHFSIFVPDARARNPITHTNWEGTGVRPDIATAASRALAKAYATIVRAELNRPPAAVMDRDTLLDLSAKIARMDDATILAL